MAKKILAGLTALCALIGVLAVAPTAAGAEIAPYALDTWGVYESVQSGTLTDAIDNEVFAIEQIGNYIYVGGKFTEVRQFSSSPPIAQNYLAAFNATTGAWISSFDPVLDRPVYALQASPDGTRLFVGGEFGDVQGVPNTRALVALDPATGAVDTSWKAQLKQDGRAVVYSMDLDSTWLYVGGTFDAVGGANGVPLTSFGRAAKLSLATAAPDMSWKPVATGGGVWGIAAAADGQMVYLAGYFSEINGVNGTAGFVGVDNTNGQTIHPARLPHNNNNRKFYQDVVTTDNLVFVAGMEHITYVLNESDLSMRTMHSTGGTSNAGFQLGGDYQDLEIVGDRVYASCHCRNNHYADGDIFRYLSGQGGSWSREDPIKFVAAYSATDGSYIPAFTLDISASSGVWAVHGATDGCLWLGGDITRATRPNGSDQPRGAITRHCDTGFLPDTERPSTPTGLSVSGGEDLVSVSWTASTDNVGVDHYDVYRAATNGGVASLVGSAPGTSFVDSPLAAGDYWYYLKAVDAAGNASWRTGYRLGTVGGPTDTERPSTPTGVTATSGVDSVSLSWTASTDNVGVDHYDVYRAATNGGVASLVGSAPGTSFVDSPLAAGDYWYYLKAVDAAGNASWRTGYRLGTVGGPTDTERPSTPTGLMVTAITTSSIDLTWTPSTDNVSVASYLVIDATSGSVIATVATPPTTIGGLASGTNYSFYVKAQDEAGNTSWRSNIVTATTS